MIGRLVIIGGTLVNLIEQYQQEPDRIAAAIRTDDADELPALFVRAKSERDSLVGSC